MIAGGNVYGVETIIGKNKLPDIDHIYAAWLNKNDYFVTENGTTSSTTDGGPCWSRSSPASRSGQLPSCCVTSTAILAD
jgi:hypothetical protein